MNIIKHTLSAFILGFVFFSCNCNDDSLHLDYRDSILGEYEGLAISYTQDMDGILPTHYDTFEVVYTVFKSSEEDSIIYYYKRDINTPPINPPPTSRKFKYKEGNFYPIPDHYYNSLKIKNDTLSIYISPTTHQLYGTFGKGVKID